MPVTNDFLHILIERLRRARLAPAASLLLEAHRPLAFVAGQLLHVASPLLAPWQGRPSSLVDDLATRLSQDSAVVDELQALLEQQEPGP